MDPTCVLTKEFGMGLACGMLASYVCTKTSQKTNLLSSEEKPVEEPSLKEDPTRVLEEDMSMFYGNRSDLSTVQDHAKKIPSEVYGSIVRSIPVFCVDVVIENQQGQVLIVKRGMHPVKDFWWWPGGRMFRGETFFTAAVRKAKQETGLDCQPVRLLGVYNTFFPTSSWDKDVKGTHTVNAVVQMRIPSSQSEVTLDDTSDNHLWIASDPASAKSSNFDRYIVEQLRRMNSTKE
eukprot:TRINITY_DN17695_c0_g1_i1.p1 TRINITY_DN17695_c0_g1~~TRINITY_DN17695_c0_g1_i1.p1  ORF type:complete len:234 (+),score=44.44 TRINITY_DN17695_c0_g1_i1:61-762(+)